MCMHLTRFCAAALRHAPRYLSPLLHSREAGQQRVLVSLMLPLLLVFVGLVVDVGNVFVHRRMAQNAADAAAMAGSARLSISQASAQTTALAYAASNNYGDDAVMVTFPTTGCIRVQVDEDVRPLLASLIWNGTFGISTRSSACMMQVDLAASVIVLAGGNKAGALTVSGNSSLIVEHGNVHVNSSSLQAVTMNGSKSKIRTETPATIVGDTDSFSAFTPEPFIGAAVLQDPLQNLPEPTKPAQCVSKQVKTTADLKSGYFCYTGGFSLNSSNSLKLPAGQYWIEGGISVNGPNAKITGDGVTLYVAGGSVDIKKCSECKLTPPESGI